MRIVSGELQRTQQWGGVHLTRGAKLVNLVVWHKTIEFEILIIGVFVRANDVDHRGVREGE